jgi:hypothetical protein
LEANRLNDGANYFSRDWEYAIEIVKKKKRTFNNQAFKIYQIIS